MPGDHEEYAPGTLCTVTGWGNTQENGQPSDILQKVRLYAWWDCRHPTEDETVGILQKVRL